MGTTFFADKMMYADSVGTSNHQRQVEILRPSGKQFLVLRMGELDAEDQGTGYGVQLNEENARELLDGLIAAMHYLGYRTDDIAR